MMSRSHSNCLRLLLTSAAFLVGPAARAEGNPIDQAIETKLKGAALAAPCTEAEFLRRLTLDLTGVVPQAADAKAYLAKPDRAALDQPPHRE